MITASHNPAIYNGIKVFTAGGRDASAQQTDEIEEYIGRIENEKVEAMEYDRALETGLIQEIYPLDVYKRQDENRPSFVQADHSGHRPVLCRRPLE